MNYILTLLGGIYFILFIARLITGPMPRIIELSNGKYDIEVRSLVFPFLKWRRYAVRNNGIIHSDIIESPIYMNLDVVENWIKQHYNRENKVKKVGYYTPESEPIKNDLLTELNIALEQANTQEEKEVLKSIIRNQS